MSVDNDKRKQVGDEETRNQVPENANEDLELTDEAADKIAGGYKPQNDDGSSA